MKTERIYLYEDRLDVSLTTYIVDDSPMLLAGRKRPAVLICPGGAYLGCADSEGEPIAIRFASMGYHAFVLRYSTLFGGKPPSQELFAKIMDIENTNCRYPNPMIEIGRAMLLIRDHADEWHVNMDKVVLNGYSAGAHNCAMFANNWNASVITDALDCDGRDIKPTAMILGYPLTDYVYTQTKNGPEANMMINFAYFGQAEPSEEALRLASPALNVNEKTPPAFIWATSQDEMVPVQNSMRMAHALADHNIPFELHVFEEGTHGLSLADQSSSASNAQINTDVAKWVDLAENWLKKRISLNLD